MLNRFEVYVLDAKPDPDYTPHSRETKLLTGMRGCLWVDRTSYQRLRVEAEVTKPVDFGIFVARVYPGTRLELEQRPVDDGRIWLSAHFILKVNAIVLGIFSRNSSDDETYTIMC